MILSALSTLALLIPWAIPALSAQVPIIDGVLGGVPQIPSTVLKKDATLSTSATTPGKLRVVENSGICGNEQLTRHQISS